MPQPPVGYGDDQILRAIHRYHYLTSEQVRRLFYGPGVITYVRSRLKSLSDAGYLQRRFLPRTTPRGNAPSIFRLGLEGARYLEEAGVDVDRRIVRPSEGKHDYLHLSHTEAINDLLISLELLARQSVAVEIKEILHERVLKRQPISVEDQHGQRQPVVPDSWIHLHVAGYQVCLALELDRGTEEQRKWRRKVANIVTAAKTKAYHRRFGTDVLTIAVLTTAGEKRLHDLRSWTAAELHDLGEEQEADLFRLAAFDPAATEPGDAFLARRWVTPFSASPEPLLEVE